MEYDLKHAAMAVLLFTGMALLPFPASAHHGIFVTYDTEQQVTLAGTVTEWKFANPHVQFSLDVTGADGNVVNWAVEGSSVYYWSRSGLEPGFVEARY